MKTIVQRVSQAEVNVDGECVGSIHQGFMLLVAICEGDSTEDLQKSADKIARMRIFEDENDKMNLSLEDIGGSILSISQFTLAADIRKGNRPSFIKAEKPDRALALFEQFNDMLRSYDLKVETGSFGAHMEVSLVNDGPVTIVVETQEGVIL